LIEIELRARPSLWAALLSKEMRDLNLGLGRMNAAPRSTSATGFLAVRHRVPLQVAGTVAYGGEPMCMPLNQLAIPEPLRAMEHASSASYTAAVSKERKSLMRAIIFAAVASIAIGTVMSVSSFAQTTTGQAPPSRSTLNDTFNRCVELARARGYSSSDLDGNRAAARNFVIRCMRGKQG